MPKPFQQLPNLRIAARCYHNFFCGKSIGGCIYYVMVFVFLDFLYRLIEKNFNPKIFRFGKKTINNGLGRIRYWKHSAIFLYFQFHPTLFKPYNGIARHKSVEGPQKFLFAPRIVLGKFLWKKLGVGNIAPSAARNLYFCEHFLSALENDYFKSGIFFRSIYGRKKSRSAAANYYNIGLFQASTFSSAKDSQKAMVSCISPKVVRGFIRHIRKTT